MSEVPLCTVQLRGGHVASSTGRAVSTVIQVMSHAHAGPLSSEYGTHTSSASLGLTKSIMSFYSTQIAKSNLFQENLSTFSEPLRSGLAKLASPIPVGQS